MINYEIVRYEFEQAGWQLISTFYKNLDGELNCVCPEGHTQSLTYREWRKKHSCPECEAQLTTLMRSQQKKNKVAPPKSSAFRILALDAATSTTGYSIYDDRELVGYGHFTVEGSDTTARINQVKQILMEAVEKFKPDLICAEHIQLQTFGGPTRQKNQSDYQVELYRVLANLQGVIADTVFETKIPFHLIYSQTWRSFCDVKGQGREEKKRAAQKKVLEWYAITATQDEADAICLGKYMAFNCNNLNIQTTKWGEEIQ